MATNKPTKPSSTLPTTFGGTKTAYSASRISSGYEANVEEIIDGGNLNYSLAGTFERLEYLTTIADVLNATPVGKTVVVDSNNRYDYETFVSDSAFQTALSGKADVDLSNLDATGQALFTAKVDLNLDNMNPSATSKQTINGWGMPDYSSIITVGNTTRTPTSNVVVKLEKGGSLSTGYISFAGLTFAISKGDQYGSSNYTYRDFYIPKGVQYTTTDVTNVYEIPLIGG